MKANFHSETGKSDKKVHRILPFLPSPLQKRIITFTEIKIEKENKIRRVMEKKGPREENREKNIWIQKEGKGEIL